MAENYGLEAGGPIGDIFGDDLSEFSDESDIETVVTMMTYLWPSCTISVCH